MGVSKLCRARIRLSHSSKLWVVNADNGQQSTSTKYKNWIYIELRGIFFRFYQKDILDKDFGRNATNHVIGNIGIINNNG